ncbi:MAG: carbon-nitrogen family hydrolase [Schwartzia sp.]|nr:carbon-nitrogen family hydrolase [Schwartzia sp. (in: firmicutes)]
MKISVLQMPVAIGAREDNEATLRRMMDAAMGDAPDVVVLPELWDIGFFPRPLEAYLDEGGARSRALLSSLAREHGVNLVGGSVAVREAGVAENRCYVFDRSGAPVASYDKSHLFSPAKEDRFFRKGDHIAVFSLDGATCGAMICYDLRFPELCRRLALEGAAIVFLPAAWPAARIEHWRVLSRARAIENQIFFVPVNGSGAFSNGMPLGGRYAIIDPWGERMAVDGDGEAILAAEIDLAARVEIKRTFEEFHDRRPELYG